MASHWPFGHLQPKLWAKEGPGVKLAVWLPTTKSRESTSSRCSMIMCDMELKSSLEESYNIGSDLAPIGVGSREIWASKVPGFQPWQFRDSFGTPTCESREKEPFGCRLGGVAQRILYGGRWWLPPSPGRDVSCGPKCPWLVPTSKGVLECELTTWVVCFDADSSLIY
jgi:hypothetical protein